MDHETPRQILDYPSYVKRLAWVHFAFCAALAGLFLYVVFAAVAAEIVTFGALLGLHLILFFRVIYPRAVSRYYVFEDRLEIHRGKRISFVRYGEIGKIYGRAFPFFVFGGNFGFIQTTGEVFNIAATLKGAEHLLDAIAEFNPARRPSLVELRANLIVGQYGFARLGEYFKGGRAFFTALHLVLIPFVFCAYMVGRQGHDMAIGNPTAYFVRTAFGIYMMVLTLGFFFAFALNRVIDQPTLERLEKNPRDGGRDLERECRIFRDAFPVYLFALFAMLGLYNRFDLNRLSVTEVSIDVPHLGLQAGQTLWIDERVNCFGCLHSVHRGDVVTFKRRGSLILGKVVATPGEVAEITAPPVPGRAPASNSMTISPGKVAIRSNPDGDIVQLVDLDDIHGRAVETLRAFLQDHD